MPASSGRVQDQPGHQNESGCSGREDPVSKRREREHKPKGQAREQEPQESVAKWLSLYRKEKLRDGRQPLGWEEGRIGNAQRNHRYCVSLFLVSLRHSNTPS